MGLSAICGSPLLKAVDEVLLALYPYTPLTDLELQTLGRPERGSYVTKEAQGSPEQNRLVPQATLGQPQRFWAENFVTRSTYQVDATLRRITDRGYIYSNNALSIPESAIDAIAGRWDGIYASATGIFGDPPDVDGDPSVTILLLDIIGGSASASSGYIAGYFSTRNELNAPASNLREMFYIDGTPAFREARSRCSSSPTSASI